MPKFEEEKINSTIASQIKDYNTLATGKIKRQGTKTHRHKFLSIFKALNNILTTC